MHRTILQARWARAIGVAATAAIVAVVFVVLILPTAAFGSSRRGMSSCKAIKAVLLTSSAKANGSSRVYFGGQHLGYVERVLFTGAKGEDRWVDAVTFDFDSAGNFYAVVPTTAGTGKIAIGASSDSPDACAFTYTTKIFHTA